MSSFTDFAGSVGCTTRINGDDVASDTGARSLSGSYGSFCMCGRIAVSAGVASNTVHPSGGALVTISAPITPPPPARLSTTTVCLRVSLILAPTVRPVMSVAPPGANGTTTRIGFAGYACASAPPAPQAPQLTAIRISLPVRNIFRPSSLPCYQSRVPALSAKRCASQPVDHHVIDSASILVRGKRYGGSQT